MAGINVATIRVADSKCIVHACVYIHVHVYMYDASMYSTCMYIIHTCKLYYDIHMYILYMYIAWCACTCIYVVLGFGTIDSLVRVHVDIHTFVSSPPPFSLSTPLSLSPPVPLPLPPSPRFRARLLFYSAKHPLHTSYRQMVSSPSLEHCMLSAVCGYSLYGFTHSWNVNK